MRNSFAAQNLEARIALLKGESPHSDHSTQLEHLLTLLFSRVAALNHHNYRDADLSAAVRRYQIEITEISRDNFNNATAAALPLTGNQHRISLRSMIILARDACDDVTTNPLALGEKLNQSSPLNWGAASGIGLSLALAASGATYLIARLLRKRERRKKRFYCQTPVQVVLAEASFSSTLLDISGLGAKIKKPDSTELDGRVQLLFDDVQLDASVQWQNAHFFGVLFNRPLRRCQLYSLIEIQRVPPPNRKAAA